MTKYQPIKVMFDLDDEYQLKLYNHVKERTNGSSYIRTLIHQDILGNNLRGETSELLPNNYKIIEEQNINDSEQPETDIKPEVESATVKATHHNIKVNSYIKPQDEMEQDIDITDLI